MKPPTVGALPLRVASGNMFHGHRFGTSDVLSRADPSVIEAAGRELLGNHALLLNEAVAHGDLRVAEVLAAAAGLPQVISAMDTRLTVAKPQQSSPVLEGPPPVGFYDFGVAIALSSDATVVSVARRTLPTNGVWNPTLDADLHTPRSMLAVTADLALGHSTLRVTFVTAHLTPQRYDNPLTVEENRIQFLDVLDFAAGIEGIVVLGGDFNIRSDDVVVDGRGPFDVFRHHGFTSRTSGATHLRYTDAEVDYQAVRMSGDSVPYALGSRSAHAATMPISDHRFILSELIFEPVVDLRDAEVGRTIDPTSDLTSDPSSDPRSALSRTVDPFRTASS